MHDVHNVPIVVYNTCVMFLSTLKWEGAARHTQRVIICSKQQCTRKHSHAKPKLERTVSAAAAAASLPGCRMLLVGCAASCTLPDWFCSCTASVLSCSWAAGCCSFTSGASEGSASVAAAAAGVSTAAAEGVSTAAAVGTCAGASDGSCEGATAGAGGGGAAVTCSRVRFAPLPAALGAGASLMFKM